MKFIKISFLALLLVSFTSCLKTKNDFAGQRDDKGQVVTAILEQQYLTGDNNNLGFGYTIVQTFDFAAPATESVKFFTLHISQPRDTKVSGNLVVNITAVAAPGAALPPAGAVTFPTSITVPAQGGTAYDFPVKFTVNKAALNPAVAYGITFTITGVSQGQYSALENTVDVYLDNSKVEARYDETSTVTDPNPVTAATGGSYGVDGNRRVVEILPTLGLANGAADRFDVYNWYLNTYSVTAANKLTGAPTSIFTPRYKIDLTTGKLLDVLNRSTGASLGATIDPSSGFTYNANDDRTFIAKYTLPLTIGGVTRTFSINQQYKVSMIQALF